MLDTKELYLAGVDIGGTNIRATIANKNGILIKVEEPVQKTGPNTAVPKQVDSLVSDACERLKITRQEVYTLGVSTCSPFKRKGAHLVVVTPNLCGGLTEHKPDSPPNNWKEIPLERELSNWYAKLKIGNDCVTAVVAEKLFGNGIGYNDLVYVTWSTGIGTGAYVDGHLIQGKNGNAPHGGHIYIAEDGPLCGCGNKGDLESLVSGKAIARDYGVGPDETGKVFAAYKSNPKARKVIDRAARNFARGLAAINGMLDTKRFVIGGSVMKRNSRLLLPLVKAEFYKSFPALSEDVEIVETGLGDYLGDMAALSLVIPDAWVKTWQKTKPWKRKMQEQRVP